MEDFRRQLLQLLSLQNWFTVPILGQLFFWIYNKSSSSLISLSRISCIRTSIWLSWLRRRKSRSQASWARLLTGWMRRGTPLALKSWRESCQNWESFVKPCSSEWRRGRNGPTDWQLSTACLTTPPSSSSEWELHHLLQSIHFLSFFLSFFKKQLCVGAVSLVLSALTYSAIALPPPSRSRSLRFMSDHSKTFIYEL